MPQAEQARRVGFSQSILIWQFKMAYLRPDLYWLYRIFFIYYIMLQRRGSGDGMRWTISFSRPHALLLRRTLNPFIHDVLDRCTGQ